MKPVRHSNRHVLRMSTPLGPLRPFPERHPRWKSAGIFEPYKHPLEHLLFLRTLCGIRRLARRPPPAVFSLEDEFSATARPRTPSGGRCQRVFASEGKQGALQFLEAFLADSFDKRIQRYARIPEKPAQIAFGGLGELLPELVPNALSYSLQGSPLQMLGDLRLDGLLRGVHGGTSLRRDCARRVIRKRHAARSGPARRRKIRTLCSPG